MKKKLLHIIDNFGAGAGAENVLFGIINNLPDYEHHLLYFNEPHDLVSKLTAKVKITHYPVNGKLGLIKAAYFLKKFIIDCKIDIIHTHLTQSIIITKLARIKTIPVFITYHSILFQKFKWGPIPTLPYLAHLLTYKKNQISIGVSNAVLNELKEKFGVTKNRYCVYNFIDEKFLQRPLLQPKTENKFKIICVGNIRPEKNFGMIFDAFKKGFKDHQNIELDIWGSNRTKINYQSELRDHGVDNLHLKGMGNDIVELMPQYDLFVSSSIYESFGISVLEAMACGVPVLLSDIPAFKELHNEYATFFRSDSVEDFIEKLHFVLNEPEKINNLRTKAFDHARKFTVQNTVNALQVVYQNHIC